ncbi:hypothetical protein V8C86DRAFT_3030945 [Haematococcus lacustris]
MQESAASSSSRSSKTTQNYSSAQASTSVQDNCISLAPLFEQYALNAPVGPEKWTKLAEFMASILSQALFKAKQDVRQETQQQLGEAHDRIQSLQQQLIQANAARTNASALQSDLSEALGQLAQAQSRVADLQEKVESLQVELDEQEARRLQPLLTSMHTTIEEPDTPPLRDPPKPPYDVAEKLGKMTKEGLIGTLVDAGIVEQGAIPGKMWLSVAHHLLPKDKAVPAGSSLADLRQRLLDANFITLAEDSRDCWEELVRKAWEKNKDGVNHAVRRQSWVHTKHTKEKIRGILLEMGYVHEVAALGPNPSRDMWRKLADKLLRPQMVA